MNKISEKVKKLNIIQRIRLGWFNRGWNIDIDKYKNAPSYIKENLEVIHKIVVGFEQGKYTEDDLAHVPNVQLATIMSRHTSKDLLSRLSIDKQIELIEIEKGLLPYTSRRYELGIYAVQHEKYDFVRNFSGDLDEEQLLRNLKEQTGKEFNQLLQETIKHFSDHTIDRLLQSNSELMSFLTEEQQLKRIEENIENLKYASNDVQLQYLKQFPEFISKASFNIQKQCVLEDITRFSKTDIQFQAQIISENPEMFQYSSKQLKNEIWQSNKYSQALKSLLKQDITNSKYIITTERKAGMIQYRNVDLQQIFEGIEAEKIETIKKFFLHSKLMDAVGNLSEGILHNIQNNYSIARPSSEDESLAGLHKYNNSQINIIRNLNPDQLTELIKIDSNYILPYLLDIKGEHTGDEFRNLASSKDRCKKVFLSMYGKEKLETFEKYIDGIYKLQEQYNTNLKNGTIDYKNLDKIPLQEFKILFNSEIMNSCNEQDIINYFNKVIGVENTSIEFKTIIQKTYGEKASAILESREGLDVHSINSLEVFDNRILDNFCEGFVHDLISYNISDFSGFLDTVKNPEKLENFKTYYEILSKVMGENVETMQKAITEFDYVSEILEKAKDKDLTEKQYSNLLSVLFSNCNLYNITTLEDLENYDEIANRHLQGRLDLIDANNIKGNRLLEYQKVICEEIFGMTFDDMEVIRKLFDLSGAVHEKIGYEESEKCLLSVLVYVCKEVDESKLRKFIDEIKQFEGIRNPIALYSAIHKTREHQMEIFNSIFLTREKMDELIRNQEVREGQEPEIYKEVDKEGIETYHLNGIPYAFLFHNLNIGGRESSALGRALTYEGQLGNSALCCRFEKRVYQKSEWKLRDTWSGSDTG